MEEPQTSAVSQEDTPETILEQENNCEVTMDQPHTPSESAVPAASGGEPTTEAESENQLRLFVTLLTVRLLTKCHALKSCSQEEWVAHTKSLVSQTMEGLAVSRGFCPDAKSTKKVCKAVLKDLQRKFCGRRLLEAVILLQDPVVDAAIVQTLQTHIGDFSARLAEKAASSFWKDLLQVTVFTAGLLAAFFLIALIP